MLSSFSGVSEVTVSDSVSEGLSEFEHPADAKIIAHTTPAAANLLSIFI